VKRPKWITIARNEYLLMTSGLPTLRRFLPPIIIAVAMLFLLVLAPLMISIVDEPLQDLISSQAGMASVAILLLTFSFYFMVIPITNTLKEEQASELEIFLSAPIRPVDVIMGKFMGKSVVYGSGAFIIAAVTAAIFTVTDIGNAQLLIIAAIVFLLLMTSLWIGTVLAAVLRTRLSRTARGTDIGKALSMILVLPLLGLMYAFISGAMFDFLNDPSTSETIRTVLGLFPTTWGAELIITFSQNPGMVLPQGSWALPAIIGVLLFTIGSFYLGSRLIDRSHNLEPTTFGPSRAKEGLITRGIRFITGSGSFSTIIVTLFKDWGRRLENLSKIAYIFGLVFLLAIFFTGPEDPFGVVITLQFMVGFLGAFVVGEVTIRGKEMLFLYRKAPGGERRLVRARLIQGWLLVIPSTILLTFLFLLFIPDPRSIELLLYPMFMAVSGMTMTAFTLGLFLIKPAFAERSGEFIINMMATLLVYFILLILVMSLLGALGLAVVYLPLAGLIGALTLYIGSRRIIRIE
jgi:hypothetical protein